MNLTVVLCKFDNDPVCYTTSCYLPHSTKRSDHHDLTVMLSTIPHRLELASHIMQIQDKVMLAVKQKALQNTNWKNVIKQFSL